MLTGKTYGLYANDAFIISDESSLSTNMWITTASVTQLDIHVVKYINKYVQHEKQAFNCLRGVCCLV